MLDKFQTFWILQQTYMTLSKGRYFDILLTIQKELHQNFQKVLQLSPVSPNLLRHGPFHILFSVCVDTGRNNMLVGKTSPWHADQSLYTWVDGDSLFVIFFPGLRLYLTAVFDIAGIKCYIVNISKLTLYTHRVPWHCIYHLEQISRWGQCTSPFQRSTY